MWTQDAKVSAFDALPIPKSLMPISQVTSNLPRAPLADTRPPILTLPLELQIQIYSSLTDPIDQLCMALTCQPFGATAAIAGIDREDWNDYSGMYDFKVWGEFRSRLGLPDNIGKGNVDDGLFNAFRDMLQVIGSREKGSNADGMIKAARLAGVAYRKGQAEMMPS